MIVKDTKCRSVVCKMSPGILGIPAQKPEHQVTDGTLSLNLGVAMLMQALSSDALEGARNEECPLTLWWGSRREERNGSFGLAGLLADWRGLSTLRVCLPSVQHPLQSPLETRTHLGGKCFTGFLCLPNVVDCTPKISLRTVHGFQAFRS